MITLTLTEAQFAALRSLVLEVTDQRQPLSIPEKEILVKFEAANRRIAWESR